MRLASTLTFSTPPLLRAGPAGCQQSSIHSSTNSDSLIMASQSLQHARFVSNPTFWHAMKLTITSSTQQEEATNFESMPFSKLSPTPETATNGPEEGEASFMEGEAEVDNGDLDFLHNKAPKRPLLMQKSTGSTPTHLKSMSRNIPSPMRSLLR